MAATMPCLTASSARSRGVHRSTGRPAAAGGMHATLIIWMICSAVKVSGAPGRGASASTVAMTASRSSASASAAANGAAAAAQRARHLRMVLGVQWSWRAKGSLRCPVAAPRTMRMRKASACGQECWRKRPSRIACCGGETVMDNGGGPAMDGAPYVRTARWGNIPRWRILPQLPMDFRIRVLVGLVAAMLALGLTLKARSRHSA